VSPVLDANSLLGKSHLRGGALAEPHQLWKGIQIMTITVAPSITRCRRALAEDSEVPATTVYLIRKSFPAVHFEKNGKGRIVFLPEGAVLRVIGLAPRLREGFEVIYERQLYNVFKADLLGPWSNPIESSHIETTRRKTMRAIAARGACA
jgi:hypothetical protein